MLLSGGLQVCRNWSEVPSEPASRWPRHGVRFRRQQMSDPRHKTSAPHLVLCRSYARASTVPHRQRRGYG